MIDRDENVEKSSKASVSDVNEITSEPRAIRKSSAALFNAASSNQVSYDDILNALGFGRTQWVLLISSGLMTLTSLSAQYAISIIAIASECEFRMNQMEKGIMMSACVTGVFLSTYLWGYLSDFYGRRTVLVHSALVTAVLQFVLMFVTNIWLFNFISLVMGISLGGVSAAVYAYLSEFNTAKNRPVVINYSTMFVSVAAIYLPAVSWLILTFKWSIEFDEVFVFRPWRLIILLTLLPGFIGALMLLPLPESPKLLLAQRREQEAVEAIEWICKFNGKKSVTTLLGVIDYVLQPVDAEEDIVEIRTNNCFSGLISVYKSTKCLFEKPHRRNFIISMLTIFGMFFSYTGMQMWYPEIVNRSSDTSIERSQTVCQILDSSFRAQTVNSSLGDQSGKICVDTIANETFIQNIIVGAAFLLGFVIQGILLNPLGRKNVLTGALCLSALSGFLLHFVSNETVIVILFCLYILLPGLSISVMLDVVVQLMPIKLRGKAVSICLTVGRLGIMLSSNVIGIMLEPVCNTTFAMFTITMLVCVFLARRLPIS